MPTWHDVNPPIGHNGFGKIDPYIDWAFERSMAVMVAFESAVVRRYPVLLRLNPGVTMAQFAAGDFFPAGSKPASWSHVVHVPAVYLDGTPASQPAYFTVLVTKAYFHFFTPATTATAQALLQTISRMTVSRQMPRGVTPQQVAAPPVPATPEPAGAGEPETVVVAVIDDGIGFANSRFRTAAGRTRVEYIWLQDAAHNADAARYGYGRSLAKADRGGVAGIDSALDAATHGGQIDEDEVYARLGAQDFAATQNRIFRTIGLHATHGTHVLDLAAGYEPGIAPKAAGTAGEDSRPIIAVQLPAATNEGTSGASLDTYVVDAIHYILDKADEIARSRGCGRLPVVINFSYGTIAGRHDGTSDLERAVDEVIAKRHGTPAPVQVVIPTGNSRLKQCHARLRFPALATAAAADRIKTLRWRVLPDDRTNSHLEIWLPAAAAGTTARVKITVTPPDGTASPAVEDTAGPTRVWGNTPRDGMCYVRYAHVPTPTNRGMFLVTVRPTAPEEDAETGQPETIAAPSGVWTITVENVGLAAHAVVEAWIQRDDTRYGHLAFGRQSYFDHADHVRFGAFDKPPETDDTSHIQRAGTINPLGTGAHPIIVGGYDRNTWRVADYSGAGAAHPAPIAGPSVVAPSDDGAAHRGVMAAGTRSGSVVTLRGTSAAAPLVARLVANRMAASLPADRAAIEALATAEEATSRPPLKEPAERAGKGRLALSNPQRLPRIDPPA
ncbi:MAG: S8 family serine peptidase [Hyphomicrobiaceae bacterium]